MSFQCRLECASLEMSQHGPSDSRSKDIGSRMKSLYHSGCKVTLKRYLRAWSKETGRGLHG